jgi:hypothetical protein
VPAATSAGLASAIANPDAEAVVPAIFEGHESGGVALAMNATVPAKDTTSAELIGMAERATAAEPEALEPWARGKSWHRPNMAPQDNMPMGEQVLEAPLPHRDMAKHGCRPDTLKCEVKHGSLP